MTVTGLGVAFNEPGLDTVIFISSVGGVLVYWAGIWSWDPNVCALRIQISL